MQIAGRIILKKVAQGLNCYFHRVLEKVPDTFISPWFWIGTHAEYDKLLRNL